MEKLQVEQKIKTAATIRVSGKVTHTMTEGLGFDWYSCYAPEVYPDAKDEDGWKKVFDHAQWLNINFVRFGLGAHRTTDDKGFFKPGHAAFDQLRRLDAWAQKRDISVILDPFGIPKIYQYEPWEGAPRAWNDPKGWYHLGVKDIDNYVNKFIVPYVKYVTEEMKCKSVTWFNHVNEPLRGNICATPPGIDDHVRYVEVLKAIRQGLNEAGLSHIGNMGPDTHTLRYWPITHMLEMNADPDPYIEGYSMHHYHSHFDWDKPSNIMDASDPMTHTIEKQLGEYVKHARERKKPFMVTEIGMFHYGWRNGDPRGIARHDNVLMESEFILRALKKGIDGALRWAWLNPGTLDGKWQLIETVDKSYKPVENPYYGYGTLYRQIDRNADMIDTVVEYTDNTEENKTLHALAVNNKDGSQALLIVNDSYADCRKVDIVFPVKDKTVVRKIVNDYTRKHEECGELEVCSGVVEYQDVLTPMSLTVFTTR